MASLAAIMAPPSLSAYGVSKAAVEALADCWGHELTFLGVSVGTAYLSWVDTGMVSGSERNSRAFAEMRAGLAWPLRTTMPVERAAGALVDAVDRRARRVFEPGYLRGLHWARGVLGPITGRRLAKLAAPVDAASACDFGGSEPASSAAAHVAPSREGRR